MLDQSRVHSTLLTLTMVLMGCSDDRGAGGDTDEPEAGTTSSGDTELSETGAEGTEGATTVDATGGGQGCDAYEPGGLEPEELMIPGDCEEPEIDQCKLDQDRDGVVIACDNADRVSNPGQNDVDGDGVGDAVDLCPVLAGDPNNTADLDNDGIGNACDSCRDTLGSYNGLLEDAGVPFGMWIRNNPYQGDADKDGIGDACDNCPTVPNCGDFGPDNPATVGADIPLDDPSLCQADANGDGIGDACQELSGAGFADGDDFDGDGLSNAVDGCPRIPVLCAEGSSPCEHADDDGDGIGNACDTCPHISNPAQLLEESTDDADQDFVGNACEPDDGCIDRRNPRTIGFFDVSADGFCCVSTYPGDSVWQTPEGLPVRLNCEDGDDTCAPVAAWAEATPGVVGLSPACEAALELACMDEASIVTLDDVEGDLDALWSFACRLPPRDQDLDGIGDSCDLCPWAHDPSNASYVDDEGREWPHDGAACNGEFSSTNVLPENGCWP